MSDLIQRYRSKTADGSLRGDAAQEAVVRTFEQIRATLAEPVRRRRFRKAAVPPKGLYLWGGVGRGKSMLMDMFVDSLDGIPVRRVHFHAFMQEIHAALHEARKRSIPDALASVARRVAAQARVLAFDEMQISDIADAMIVGRLFEMLFAAGVVVVTTSNRVPDDLYKDGLNRQLFVPFIELVKARLTVLELAGSTDYRRDMLRGAPVYFTPADAASRARIKAVWHGLSGGPSGPLRLPVQGRTVEIPEFRNGAARASFYELCGKPLGPADYLALADAVKVLVLQDIPRLSRSNFNEARRFVILIDALYEAGVRLICSAAAPPDMLYVEGEGSFEFARTASRLREMQAGDWGR